MESGCISSPQPAGVLLDQYKRLLGKVVPTLNGAHDRFQKYEYLCIVYDEDTLVAYISRKCVPEGVDITNREFWQPMNVSGFMDDNIIIVTDKTETGQIRPYTLEEVIKTIPEVARKAGCILSFFSLEGGSHWELWQYENVNTYEWEDPKQWRTIYNAWNKFVGWYDTEDELYALKVGQTEGKYAIVGETLATAKIYQGVKKGWLPLDINLYQKFLNDLLELIEAGEVTLTDEQKEIFRELIGCTCGKEEEKPDTTGSVDWGTWGRPFTQFEIVSDMTVDEDLILSYPKSIYHDSSEMKSGSTRLSELRIPAGKLANLDLKFTAGTWTVIENGKDALYPDILENKDKVLANEGGCLILDFETFPSNMQLSLDKAVPANFYQAYTILCDGKDHLIELSRAADVMVTINYYSAPVNGGYVGQIRTETISVPYGEVMEQPDRTDFRYKGHTFVGWATNSSIISDDYHIFDVVGKTDVTPRYFDFSKPITDSVVLYAWYDVTSEFAWTDNDGGHIVYAHCPYAGYLTDIPEVGEYTGYTFAGWNYFGTTYKDAAQIGPVYHDSRITGLWDQDEVEETYNFVVINNSDPFTVVNGHIQPLTGQTGETSTKQLSGRTTFTMSYESGRFFIDGNAPSGYHWLIDGNDASGIIEATSETVNAGRDIIIYLEADHEDVIEWKTVTGKTKCVGFDLYTVERKYINDEATTQERTGELIEANSTSCGYEPTKVYYTVTFDSDGGSAVASQTVQEGHTASEPADPTKTGYTFKEWQLNGKTYNFNADVESDITLKATWNINNYTVSFDSNGGTTVPSQTVNYGGTATKPSNPTKSGYKFEEWQLGGSEYAFSTPVTGNITLVARWTSTTPTSYTVTFDSAGGTSVATQTVTAGGKATEPTAPTKTGSTFAGWYNGSTEYDFNTAVNSNITLTAHWTVKKLTVIFDSNGGSSVSSQTVYYNGTATEPAAPIKAGFTFVSWQLDGSDFSFSTKITEDITLKAIWETKYDEVSGTIGLNSSNGAFASSAWGASAQVTSLIGTSDYTINAPGRYADFSLKVGPSGASITLMGTVQRNTGASDQDSPFEVYLTGLDGLTGYTGPGSFIQLTTSSGYKVSFSAGIMEQ